MAKVETVRIEKPGSPRGFRIINRADFDEKKHKLFKPLFGDGEPGDAGAERPPTLLGFDLRAVVSDKVAEALAANSFDDPVAVIQRQDELTGVKGVGDRIAEALVEYASGFIVTEEEEADEGGGEDD